MNSYDRIGLNLASHPLRNRRFFFICSVLSIMLILGILGWGGYIFFKYHGKVELMSETIGRMNSVLQENSREKTKYQTQIDTAKKEYQAKVDYMNSIIWTKSFPWLDLLISLEKSLPDSCYIVAMMPNIDEDKWLNLKFEVASPTINDLLEFITNLQALDLDQVSLSSENRNKEGLLLTEVTLRYERTY
ncbi:MAG: hypothetical protein JW755_08175 [Candidatus Aminicenantes bacterium]|nr:hypothetical protein [Candidatus Aminicenantes bacterium]